jgi:hypothetical protein
MVKLVGPAMSLSASGSLGNAINFTESKSGNILRLKKRAFTSSSPAWEANQALFNAASVLWSSFTVFQQKAWAFEFLGQCDVPRDKFMGEQIKAWRIDPYHDLSWPENQVPAFPPLVGREWDNVDIDTCRFSWVTHGTMMYDNKICGFEWYASESKTALVNPILVGTTTKEGITLKYAQMPTPHMWCRFWRSNGVLDPHVYCSSR